MSINSLLSMSQQAMQVNQYALNVVSNNISNVNTEGYAKQRVELAENGNYTTVSTANGVVKIGSGVKISNIISYRNEYLDDYYRDNNSDANMDAVLSEYGGYIEEIFKSDLDQGGLSGVFNEFYDAAQKLSSNPSDLAMRTNFMEQAQTVAQTLNDIYKNVASYKTTVVGNLLDVGSVKSSQSAVMVGQINDKLSQIADINAELAKTAQNATPSADLINSRAKLMDELSQFISFDTTYNENGTVSISIAGTTVVKASDQKVQFNVLQGTVDQPIVIEMQDMNGNTIKGKEDVTAKLDSGQLGAFLQLGLSNDEGNFSINNILDRLNKLASEFAKTINDIQTYNDGNTAAMAMTTDNKLQAVDENNVIFLDGFGGIANITAENIQINTDLLNNPWLVAVSRVEITADGLPINPDAIGNNLNMLEIIGTRDNGIASLNGVSPFTYYTNMVSELGNDVAALNSAATVSESLSSAVLQERNSAMGVNMDEELVDLIKYQKAYESSARIFSIANEVYDVLVNLGR